MFVFLFYVSDYSEEFINNIKVEGHGVLLDILIIGILIAFIQHKYRQQESKRILEIITPKFNRLISGYKFCFRLIGQKERSKKLGNTRSAYLSQPNWNDIASADFMETPDVAPWDGNVADYLKWKIENIEKELNQLIFKYSSYIDTDILEKLETMIGHNFTRELTSIPEMITLNSTRGRELTEFRYFKIQPEGLSSNMENAYNQLTDTITALEVNLRNA